MTRRISPFAALIIALFINVTGWAQNPGSSTATASTTRNGAPAVKTGKDLANEKIEGDLSEALTVIESNYVGGKKLDYNDVVKGSIDGMLHTLDPHSNYFDAKEFEQFRTDQSSRYYGIGATIGDLSDANGKVIATYIKATFENAPANRAGLRYGDKIVEVNGVSVLGKPFTDVREKLRGPRGTLARLVVERYGTGKRETVDIIRDAVPQPSISEVYMIRPGVGYMALSGGFNQTTYAEFVEGMKSLKAQGMQQLVLDLRGNGGGLVGQAYRVASAFLSTGQAVFTQKGRLGQTSETIRVENEFPDKTPLVLLVNSGTASASEILAGALQDHDRALIVGENTFGKGLVQNPFMLDYGTMLLLTIAKYETPSGRLIQRDYSNGNLYDYYTNGGIGSDDTTTKPFRGPESKTDSGRAVYSGGGINPDVVVKPDTIPTERGRAQAKLLNPIFAFALDVGYGKIAGFDAFKVDKPISFEYDIKPNDFAVTDAMFQTFKKYAVEKFNVNGAFIDREREFVERALRTEFATAAYGTQTSFQIQNEIDNQLQKAIQLLPQAKQLALQGEKANAANATRNRSMN